MTTAFVALGFAAVSFVGSAITAYVALKKAEGERRRRLKPSPA